MLLRKRGKLYFVSLMLATGFARFSDASNSLPVDACGDPATVHETPGGACGLGDSAKGSDDPHGAKEAEDEADKALKRMLGYFSGVACDLCWDAVQCYRDVTFLTGTYTPPEAWYDPVAEMWFADACYTGGTYKVQCNACPTVGGI